MCERIQSPRGTNSLEQLQTVAGAQQYFRQLDGRFDRFFVAGIIIKALYTASGSSGRECSWSMENTSAAHKLPGSVVAVITIRSVCKYDFSLQEAACN